MSWITFICLLTTGLCLALAAVHLLVWFLAIDAWADLLFSIATVSAAARAFADARTNCRPIWRGVTLSKFDDRCDRGLAGLVYPLASPGRTSLAGVAYLRPPGLGPLSQFRAATES
jgi:hypothetical protein